jgi:tripartite-type tricarboxylate transporter receptor subunit TctC
VPWVLTARAEAGYETLEDFIKAARESDTPTSLEISGLATSDHFGFLLLLKAAGLSPDMFKWNPHGGGGPKMRAMLANEGDLMLEDAGEIAGYVRAGTLVPLAVAAAERLPQLPDVPTMKELGYDVTAGMSTVLYAPGGLTPERLEILRAAMRQIKEDPEVINALELTSQDPATFIVDGYEALWERDFNDAEELLKEVIGR